MRLRLAGWMSGRYIDWKGHIRERLQLRLTVLNCSAHCASEKTPTAEQSFGFHLRGGCVWDARGAQVCNGLGLGDLELRTMASSDKELELWSRKKQPKPNRQYTRPAATASNLFNDQLSARMPKRKQDGNVPQYGYR